MKNIKTTKLLYIVIILLVFIVIHLSKDSNNVINNNTNMNKPLTKQLNLNTQEVYPFRQLGVLYKKDDNLILPLYGRQTHIRSHTWNYYTTTNDEMNLKLEIHLNNRSCLDKVGCKEIYTDDTIYIPEYNSLFTVRLY